jgi:hypothetical protein
MDFKVHLLKLFRYVLLHKESSLDAHDVKTQNEAAFIF